MKIMNAKFAGRCNECKQAINVGDTILWEAGKGARHNSCPAITLAPIVVQTMPAVPTATVDQNLIVSFLNNAKNHGLKFPKVRFIAPQGGELRLSLAGSTSKYPGAVQVKVNGMWMGRINADSTVVGQGIDGNMLATLTEIAKDPAAAAKAYGALMGACSFCGLKLTDEGSVEVGYGPICAKHYGLPHSPKGTRTVSVVPVPAAGADVLATELPIVGMFKTIIEDVHAS